MRYEDLRINEVTLESGVWHRVGIGPRPSKYQLEDLCSRIISSGYEHCKVMDSFGFAGSDPGHYGSLELEPIAGSTNQRVVSQIRYVDRNARVWTVPAGTITDGASIPSVAQPIVGRPFDSQLVRAAAVHDYYCETRNRDWMSTHDVFYDVLIDDGVNRTRALTMWAAVYRFGPRWTAEESTCWGTCAGDNAYLDKVIIQPKFIPSEYERIEAAVRSGQISDRERLRDFIDQNMITYWDLESLSAEERRELNGSTARLVGRIRMPSDSGPGIPKGWVDYDGDAPPEWVHWGRKDQ